MEETEPEPESQRNVKAHPLCIYRCTYKSFRLLPLYSVDTMVYKEAVRLEMSRI